MTRSREKDDWVKPRERGDHLTDAEKDFIAAQMKQGVSSRVVARELQCSSRVVSKWFSIFSGRHPERSATSTSPDSAHYCVSKLCFVDECYRDRREGSKFCEHHTYVPPVSPLMMAGRA